MYSLKNDFLSVEFSNGGKGPFAEQLTNKLTGNCMRLFDFCMCLSIENAEKVIITPFNITDIKTYQNTPCDLTLEFRLPDNGLLFYLNYRLFKNEVSYSLRIHNAGDHTIKLVYINLMQARLDNNAERYSSELNTNFGDSGEVDMIAQKRAEAYPIFIDDEFFCGIDWPVAQNDHMNDGIICRQYFGDLLMPGGELLTRSLTIGVSNAGMAQQAFIKHLLNLRNRETHRASFYYDWLIHASEGVNENEMAYNIKLMELLKNQFGIQFDIYAVDDGIVETRWYKTFDRYRSIHEDLFPSGLKNLTDRLADDGVGFGIWIGPNGLDETEYQAQARMNDVCNMIKSWNVHLIKFDVCVHPALNDDPIHNEHYMRNLDELVKRCREIQPDLIIINHRITESPYILSILDSTLWQGAESYPDIFMYNWDKPRLFTRYSCYSRGLPTYCGVYSDLLEDCGICFNGFREGWENEFVLQTFGRALMLSPEVYGCLFLLEDEDYPTLSKLMQMAKEKANLLKTTIKESDSAMYIHCDGEKALICCLNDSWNINDRKIIINESIGIQKPSEKYSVKRLYPFNDENNQPCIGWNQELTIKMHPFAICVFEIVPSKEFISGQNELYTLPLTKMQNCYMPIDQFKQTEILEDDIAIAEKIRFKISSEPLEIQALNKLKPSLYSDVNLSRKWFFNKVKRECDGVASNAWDNDENTVWCDDPHWKDSDNIWRLDLGDDYKVDNIKVTLSTIKPGPVYKMEFGRKLTEPIFFEVSSDTLHWNPVQAELFYKRVPYKPYEHVQYLFADLSKIDFNIRYIRMRVNGISVSDIKVRRRINGELQNIDSSAWKGNNLLSARTPISVFQSSAFTIKKLYTGQYIAATIELPETNIKLNQEVAMVWVQNTNQEVFPMLNASPVFPTYNWECEATLTGNAGWTFYIPVSEDMADSNELFIKVAWFGPLNTPACPDIKGYVVIV